MLQMCLEVQLNLPYQQQNIMGIKKNIKDLLQKCDFFCSTEYLRYKKQPQYKTVFGGLMSIFLILSLMIIFYNKVINTLNMMSISSSTSVQVFDDPLQVTITTKGEKRRSFMFGVQIWHHNLNEGLRYFDINFRNMEFAFGDATNGSIEYPLQPCTMDHWKGYPLILEKFQSLRMSYWLCPPVDTDFVINGKYASAISRTMEVSVNKCTNNSYSTQPCADSDQLRQFFESFEQKVFFTIYFVNPRINPDQAEFLTYYMEDVNYIIFSQTGGEEAQLMVDDFTIQTDDSISPFPLILEETGSIVQRTAIKNRFEIPPYGTNYCTFFFYKSANSLQIIRSYQKLDEILSYIGGLFGTIAICLFMIRIYNGYSFQIHLGAILYKHDQEKEGYHKYNFLYFIAQCIYNFLKLFGGGGGLERAKGYQRCRQELLKQLDVLYLLKRVSYLQRALGVMLDDHQLKGIHLLKKPTLSQARRYRKNFKLQQKVVAQSENHQYNRKDTNTTSNPNNQTIAKKNTVDNEDIYDFTIQDMAPDRQVPSHRSAQAQAEQTQSSSSDDDETMSEGQNKNLTLEQLLRIKHEKDASPINQRIFSNLSDNIRRSINLYDEKCRLFLESQDENMSASSTLKVIAFKPRRRVQAANKTDQFAIAKLLKPVQQNDVQSSQQDHFQYLPTL